MVCDSCAKIEADRQPVKEEIWPRRTTGRARGRPQERPQPYPERPHGRRGSRASRPPRATSSTRRARILLADGYAGVTLEAVALEAGEDRATIKRHFGSKAGLIHALFDQLGDDIFEDVTESRRARCRQARSARTC